MLKFLRQLRADHHHVSDRDLLLLTLFEVRSLKLEISTMSTKVQDALTKLQADVAAEKTVEQSAITLIQGIPAQIQTAVQAAIDAGADPATLQGFADLSSGIEANTADLAAAVTTGTGTPTDPAPGQPGSGS